MYPQAVLKSLKEDIKIDSYNNILSSFNLDLNSDNKNKILLYNGDKVHLANYSKNLLSLDFS